MATYDPRYAQQGYPPPPGYPQQAPGGYNPGPSQTPVGYPGPANQGTYVPPPGDTTVGYPVYQGGPGPWSQGIPPPEAFGKDRVAASHARENYQHVWQISIWEATYRKPGFCLLSALCAPCVSYHLRKRTLYNDMSRYTCCGGYLPCSGRCGESSCPQLCLGLETFLCFPNSVAVTRFLIQDELRIANTQCDNCLIISIFACQYLACIVSLVACIVGDETLTDAANILTNCADLVYCSVCACMQAQHHRELDVRDGKVKPRGLPQGGTTGVQLAAPEPATMM